MTKLPLIAALLLAVMTARAEPVVIDMDGARVIVVRPMDSWSGDAARSESSLETLKKRHFGFEYRTGAGERYKRGYPTALQGVPEDDPLVARVKSKAADAGLSVEQTQPGLFRVDEPVEVPSADMHKIIAAQRALFGKLVAYQGDPQTLESRVSQRKVAGGVLALASTIFVADKLGTLEGARLAVDARLPQDLYAGVSNLRSAGSALELPELDFSGFQTVVVRRTSARFGERAGQIVIAFRGPRDEAIEREALAEAIVITGGKGATEQSVAAARQADFQRRLTIWQECVARGDQLCK